MHHIQIPWRNRSSYLRITLATLLEAGRDRGDFHITIFNNASEEQLPEIAHAAIRIGVMEEVDLPVTDCHHNYVYMLNWMFDHYPDADYVINIDADACIHPEFFNAIDRLVVDCPDFGHASLFNWDSHPEDKERFKENYIPRGHSSFFCSMIRRGAWRMFTPPKFGEAWRFGCADGHLSTFIHEETPFRVYSTLRSYVEHIGFSGQHAGFDDDGKSNTVRARRFYP